MSRFDYRTLRRFGRIGTEPEPEPPGPAPDTPIFALVIPPPAGDRIADKPWVARITGLSDHFGVRRQFLRPLVDWSHARGRPGRVRGLSHTFVLRVGWVVEACYLQDPHDEVTSRFFARVQPAGLQPIEVQEVVEWAVVQQP